MLSIDCLPGQETQDDNTTQLSKFGIGLDLEKDVNNNFYFYYYFPLTSQLVLTWNINDKFRLEPELSFSLTNYYDGDYDYHNKEKVLNLGLGGYGLFPKNAVCIFYGIRFNYQFYRRDRDSSPDIDSRNMAFSIGPVIGMDYFISRHFSIGSDFKVLYVTELMRNNYDPDDSDIEESSYKNMSTIAGLRFRFYF
jgi:hypothetical protein